MNMILSAMRNHGRLSCAWVPTGNLRTPLACVWKEASPSLLTRTDQSPPTDDVGGIGLCA